VPEVTLKKGAADTSVHLVFIRALIAAGEGLVNFLLLVLRSGY
jgi:hypothetical protein